MADRGDDVSTLNPGLARFPANRPRRIRKQAFSRRMVAENVLDTSQLIQPFFIIEGDTTRQAVESCLLYTSPSPRDLSTSRMPSSA